MRSSRFSRSGNTLLVLRWMIAQGGRVSAKDLRARAGTWSFMRDLQRNGVLQSPDFAVWEITPKGRRIVDEFDKAWRGLEVAA